MDLALTSWTSLWVEGQELKQKAAFYVIGRQGELKVHMLRAWKEEAAWVRLKRERLEMYVTCCEKLRLSEFVNRVCLSMSCLWAACCTSHVGSSTASCRLRQSCMDTCYHVLPNCHGDDWTLLILPNAAVIAELPSTAL